MSNIEQFLKDYYGSQTYLLDSQLLSELEAVFDDINLEKQRKKLLSKGLAEDLVELTIQRDRNRFVLLISLATHYNLKNIVEVGTADGCQSFSFVKYFEHIGGGHIWTCDIIDAISKKLYTTETSRYCTFINGDSSIASNSINKAVDLFFIDGDHSRGAVVKDIANLKRHQSKNCIWVFDDYDVRFGCYDELSRLHYGEEFDNFERVKIEISDNNHILIMKGRFKNEK